MERRDDSVEDEPIIIRRHVLFSPESVAPVPACGSNFSCEIVMIVIPLQVTMEEHQGVPEIRVVNLYGDVVHPWHEPIGKPEHAESVQSNA